jgi:aminopeptidase N
MSRLWFFIALTALLMVLPARAEAPFKFETTLGNLPKDVRPLSYRIDLDLVPDPGKLSSADGKGDLEFKGRVDIEVEVSSDISAVTFDSVELALTRVSVDGQQAVLEKQDKKLATYRLAQPAARGRHKIEIDYTGKISPKPQGLYYVNYNTPQGQRRILVTQFEAVNARRMFPGWDEPVFKATFALSAVMPDNLVPISNMPIAREEPVGAGKKRITFDPSPKMSSYLLVLVAGQFDLPLRQTIAGVDVGVFAPEGRAQEGRFALDVMAKILPYFNDYFGVKYPLPKLDHIAIPDFAAGAMENWGGVTYVDNRLLFDPARSSQKTREDIFEVVTHETAHQWSGNLVTMAWWDNLWLNEGWRRLPRVSPNIPASPWFTSRRAASAERPSWCCGRTDLSSIARTPRSGPGRCRSQSAWSAVPRPGRRSWSRMRPSR